MATETSVDSWDDIIQEAANVDQAEGPQSLLAALSHAKNPFSCEDEVERVQLREAHQADLGAIYRYCSPDFGFAAASSDRKILVDRLAWFLRTLETCQQQRPSMVTLVALLRVGSAFSRKTCIWQHLPSTYVSENLVASMAALVGATQCSFRTVGQPEPIWERETVDRFLQADSDGDWPEIERIWKTIASALGRDNDLAEATACLCSGEKGLYALALALDAGASILQIMNVANTMSAHQISEVAVLANSYRVRFVLAQSLAFNQRRNEVLQEATLANLAKLFQSVQKDDAEWLKWMQAFNRYPVRTKALQSAFGASLVGSEDKAKAAYIDAIDLSTANGECRLAVTICLSEFCKSASRSERESMWTLSMRRWETWNFDSDDSGSPLTWMAVCDLDFALIGYGVECLSDSEFANKIQTLWADLTAVQNEWYPDHTSFNAAWYRALSRWQIFSYTAEVRAGNETWEIPRIIRLPFNPKSARYLAMSLPTILPYGVQA